MIILVTGGLGYIGSSFCLEACKYHQCIVLDMYDNSYVSSILLNNNVFCHIGNVNDKFLLNTLLSSYNVDLIVHFAAYKSVPESILNPIKYYDNNINGLMNVLSCMKENNVKKIIFSSSATVYGQNQINANENTETGKGITNPYGMTKYICEQILIDYCKNSNVKAIILRYFNPIGVCEIPFNKFPKCSSLQSSIYEAINYNTTIKVYGNTYNTVDGTCLRDYIWLDDLINGHMLSIYHLDRILSYDIFNLGTGTPLSVIQMIKIFEKIFKKRFSVEIINKRIGDIESSYCNPTKAKDILCWTCKNIV